MLKEQYKFYQKKTQVHFFSYVRQNILRHKNLNRLNKPMSARMKLNKNQTKSVIAHARA